MAELSLAEKLKKAESDLQKAKSPMRRRDLEKYIRRLRKAKVIK